MLVIGSITKLNIILGKLIAAERLRDSITNLQGTKIYRIQPPAAAKGADSTQY